MTATATSEATSPADVRAGLTAVTAASAAAIAATAAEASEQGLSAVRAALIETTPIIAQTFGDAAAALGAAWYDDLRDASGSAGRFLADPVTNIDPDLIRASVASLTERLVIDETPSIETATKAVQASIQKDVAGALRDTVTENSNRDSESVGYQRYTRGVEACPFCKLLADKGAIYKKHTAHFAAHTTCHCIAGPAFGPQAGQFPEADAMQYVASSRVRTKAEKKALRDVLRDRYGAASAPH